MGRKDERSGTDKNTTAKKPTDKQLGDALLRKMSGKSAKEMWNAAVAEEKKYNAGRDDRN